MNVLRWALLGLCVVVALAADADNAEVKDENRPVVVAESEVEVLADADFQVRLILQCLTDKPKTTEEAREKRDVYSRTYTNYGYNGYNYGYDNRNYVDSLNLGLGLRRYDYQYFPNTFGYNSRFSSFYPEDLRQTIYQLPAARFLNSFYPGPINRLSDGVVTRSYFRTGLYDNALADFRLFPLQNVRSLATTTTTSTDVVPGYVGTFRNFPYEVRVCNNCCSGGYPCIRFTGQSYPYQQITRNYVYVRNGLNVAGYNGFV